MKWISDLIDLIFPRHCAVCGEILSRQERDLCLNCLYTLPKIEAHHKPEIEQSFWGKVEIERATSFMYYRKGSPYNTLMHKLKYHNAPEVGRRLAQIAARELHESDFFNGITLIVPLPLSKKKQRKRGYNQSAKLAEGISQITGIPVATNVIIRQKFTDIMSENGFNNVKLINFTPEVGAIFAGYKNSGIEIVDIIKDNIKITYPEDVALAEHILLKRNGEQ